MQKATKASAPGGPVILCLIILNAVVMKEALISRAEWNTMLPFTLLILVVAGIAFRTK